MKAFLKTHWRGEKRHRYFTVDLYNLDVVYRISAAPQMERYSIDVGEIIGHFGGLAIDIITHPDREHHVHQQHRGDNDHEKPKEFSAKKWLNVC